MDLLEVTLLEVTPAELRIVKKKRRSPREFVAQIMYAPSKKRAEPSRTAEKKRTLPPTARHRKVEDFMDEEMKAVHAKAGRSLLPACMKDVGKLRPNFKHGLSHFEVSQHKSWRLFC